MSIFIFPNFFHIASRAAGFLTESRRTVLGLIAIITLTLQGCALQPAYVMPEVAADGQRLLATSTADHELSSGDPWWLALNDPAINQLVDVALAANPTLSRAVALVDQARAEARIGRSGYWPTAVFEGSASRSRSGRAEATGAKEQSTGQAELTLNWEVDLFGRVRHTARASAYRLDSQVAEAEGVRLALVADIADGVLGLRACQQSLTNLSADIRSRQAALALTVRLREAGFVAEVDVALARTGLATTESDMAQRRQDCVTRVNGLVVLTGLSQEAIMAAMSASPEQPDAPPMTDALPATALRFSPGVVAAERKAAAAWSDIAVARADQMPRLNLIAALSGQWVRALGISSDSATGSLGSLLSFPILDGAKGASTVSIHEALYVAAVADLDMALRTAARDVQNALEAGISARRRLTSADQATDAARVTLAAREAQWRAGAISQFELEEARRQLTSAQDSLFAAKRDAAQAWVALQRATASHSFLSESSAQ